MAKSNIKFNKNNINGSVFEGAVIGDNNSKDNTYTNSFNKGNNNVLLKQKNFSYQIIIKV